MEPVALVTAIALTQYMFFCMATGKARQDAGVKAPAITGDLKFECLLRIQQNTIEQLVIMLPSMWLFAYYIHSLTAAGLGLLFVLSRFAYSKAYSADPPSRGLPFAVGGLINMVLLIGGAIGAILSWI